MNIANFFTQNIAPASDTAAKPGATKKNPFDVFQTLLGPDGQALSFKDIVNKIALEKIEEKKKKPEDDALITLDSKAESALLQSDNPVLAVDAKLDFATLVASTPALTGAIENSNSADDLITTLALNQQAFDDILNVSTLTTTGLPGNSEPNLTAAESQLLGSISAVNDLLKQLQNAQPGSIEFKKLVTDISQILSQQKNLVAQIAPFKNLTPEQSNDIQNVLQDVMQQLNAGRPLETLEPSKIIELVGKIETAIEKIATASSFASVLTKTMSEPNTKTTTMQNEGVKEAHIVKDVVIKEMSVKPDTAPFSLSKLSTAPLSQNTILTAQNNSSDQRPISSEIEMSAPAETITPAKKSDPGNIFNLGNTKQNTPAIKTNPGVAVQNTPAFLSTAFDASENWQTVAYDDFATLYPVAHLSSPTNAINLSTQAPAASLPHPTTQITSSALQKLAGGGVNKALEIQLDPPELGRLNIRMEFGKDKIVRAIIMSEKPETHLMLQRDAHVLERALQNAGLDTDQSSLQFSLTGEGQNFSHNGGHDGQRNYSGTKHASKLNNENDDVLQTTMTWVVDPETGHTHYSIIA